MNAPPTPQPKNMLPRWLAVCLIPLGTALWFSLNAPYSDTRHLINGIILVCEGVFLLKFVLFEAIAHHLKQEYTAKQQTLWLLLPLLLLSVYLLYYFGLFGE